MAEDQEEYAPFYTLKGYALIGGWQSTHQPPPIVYRAVCDFVNGLYDDPRQDPAQDVEREEPHSLDPVFYAEVPGTWVGLTWAVNEVSMEIRLLEVEPVPKSEQHY